MEKRILIVGAGFTGAVLAERLAQRGYDIVVYEARSHVGGNAFDEHDANGVLVHRYGPHIFHTSSETVVKYLSQFTAWHPYEHRVLARLSSGQLMPIPINRTTLGMIDGNALLNDDEAAARLQNLREQRNPILTSEDAVISAVGTRLYETFFKGYTLKQWGRDPSQLDALVASRIPTRTTLDDRYFSDPYQIMPKHGYAELFRRLLDHPNIKIELNTAMDTSHKAQKWRHVFYTGPIDRFFAGRYGQLPYRSLEFAHEHLPDREWHQPVAVVNEVSNKVPYTRTTEFKHLTGQVHRGTSIVREYPRETGEPYYPIPSPATRAIFERYSSLAKNEKNVTFVGRLAQYKYVNMDQAVSMALAAAKQFE